MEGGESEDTTVQADYLQTSESKVSGAAGDCHGDRAAMAVYGERCQ